MSHRELPMIGCCSRCAQLYDECTCEESARRRQQWLAGDTGANGPGKAFLNRFANACSADEREKATLLLDALRMFPDEAVLFADYVLRQERLPASARAQQKAARNAKYKREYYRAKGWGTPV